MQSFRFFGLVAALLLSGLTVHTSDAHAQDTCEPAICKISSIQGSVTVKRKGSALWTPVRLNETYCPGDQISTGAHSRAVVVLNIGTVLRMDQETSIAFLDIEEEKSFLLSLFKGAAHFFSRKARSLKIITPLVNGGVEGTEFFVNVDSDETLFSLFEGRLLAENAYGELLLAKGQSAITRSNQPPQLKLVARPRDAVHWALYYPPIIVFNPEDAARSLPDDMQSKLSQSIKAYRQGDLIQAFAMLDGLGDNIDDARFFIYRASLYLTVGRVAKAKADIERALGLDSGSSEALALRSIAAVVQNQKAAAYAAAQQAVALDADAPAALIALSYAHQAKFDLPAAIAQAQSAVDKAPDNAIARARLAELRLSIGDLDGALRAATMATELDANSTHAQTVMGYAHLTQMEIGAAETAFVKAIHLDSAAPLPRLGLGLAKIRQGHLMAGRAEIEIAAGLDPANALIRSYLGKAYFDEKRSPLEERQFEIAKELDPQDPTPWFYDAIRKQTQNRPVAALQDLQKSIELNDNRAVYRSRLLMDEDLAARSASLGRIYNDLKFQELALRQGWRSLQADPTNYSAHRLLADTYRSRPRYEVARVSELLQTQLLQPLSLTPVQSQLAESNLLILESAGPDSAAFNEFNPLFARNRVAAQIDGLAGDSGTWGDNVTLSGVYNKFSGSVTQFHYQTDGFRNNNDLDQNIYGTFLQAAITPKVNVQAEYRYRNSESGDLRFNSDENIFDSTFRQDSETNTLRAGIHFKSGTNSDIIGSVIYQNVNETQESIITDMGFSFPLNVEGDSESFGGELQYLLRNRLVDIIAGVGHYDVDTKIDVVNIFEEKIDERNSNGYVYCYVTYPEYVTWTIGTSYNAAEQEGASDKNELSPKIGMSLDVGQNTTMRVAAFTNIKRALVADQTIEPTNVAGFNQLFDDVSLTEYSLYGAGVDHKLSKNLYGGAEFFLRDIKTPFSEENIVREEDWEENIFRAYLYWAFNRELAFGVEYWHEFFEAENSLDPTIPKKSETEFLPITLSYFHPSGSFGRLVSTYVSQEILRAGQPENREQDGFVLVDAVAGYRLPKRMGVLSAEIRNVFDQDFDFVDDSTRFPGDIQKFFRPLFLPQRSYVLRLTMSF